MTSAVASRDAAELDAIAAELYALPPAEFTAARNARAARADRTLAARIKTLRKPSVAAWAVNVLARAGDLAEALDLAQALREAQDDLDAAELSRLSRQRRALVAGLARQAATLAADQGVAVSAAARDEVEKTLNAAVMDAGAAGAVMSGRLVRTLEATGFDQVDVDGAVAGSASVAAPASRDDLAERRARKAAERAAREAERAESEARRELSKVEDRLAKARERADHLHERAEELRTDLERVEHDAAAADAQTQRLDGERAGTASRARDAADAAKAAQQVLDA